MSVYHIDGNHDSNGRSFRIFVHAFGRRIRHVWALDQFPSVEVLPTAMVDCPIKMLVSSLWEVEDEMLCVAGQVQEVKDERSCAVGKVNYLFRTLPKPRVTN